jgi:hypothetical protein
MTKKTCVLWLMASLVMVGVTHPIIAQNLATNGSFEMGSAGTPFPNDPGGSTGAWRFFAVGGADGAATISTQAATDGLVGVELARNATGVGDSALDKDTPSARESIPLRQAVYKALVDVKDGGANGGTPRCGIGLQFQTGASNRGVAFDPSADFETLGLNAVSDNLGTISVRMDLTDAVCSALVDNVRLYDVTVGANRMVNPGFENSASRLLNWRTYSLNPGELVVGLSNDAHTGSRAVSIERTFAEPGSDNDAGVDTWDDRIGVIPGEIIELSYWAKKVSGDDDFRVFPKVVQFDEAGNVIKQTWWFTSNPGTTAYQRFGHTVGIRNDARYVSIHFLSGNRSGADRHVGAYLLDDVDVRRAANALSNGSFEEFSNEQSLDILANSNGWRFFAVGGAVGTGTARATAATDGAVGIELTRDAVLGGDSALDRDIGGDGGAASITMPQIDLIYKIMVDVKDGGIHGGSDLFHLDSQILDGVGTTNRGLDFDPGSAFETIGVNAGSGTDSRGSIRMDFRNGDANRSAFLDNTQMLDVTRGDRMINGGFENSATRMVNYRYFSLNAGEYLASLENDPNSGVRALRVERTMGGEGTNDGAVDIDSDRIVVRPGETVRLQYSVKKVSGDEQARPFVSLAQFDEAGAWLGPSLQYNFNTANPGTGAYETVTHVIPIDATARLINLGFRVGNDSGSDRHVGAFLYDDIKLVGNQLPSFNGAAITPATPNATDILVVTAAGFADPDNDGEGYLYQWKKNGVNIPGATTPKLTPLNFTGGDKLSCVVTAFDGYESGNSVETDQVTITPTSIQDWRMY